MVELEVESNVGEGEFVVDMPEREDENVFVQPSLIPKNTISFQGIKGRFFINSPVVRPGDGVFVVFNGKFNGKSISISGIEAVVETVNSEEINLRCKRNYSFKFKEKKLYLRRQKLIIVLKKYNGQNLKFTF